ncbi:MAG: DUF6316 family protein [Halioglobus sp.]
MVIRRASDFGNGRTWYRSDRMIEDGGKWHFQTREGSIEGPFEDVIDAAEALEAYIGAKALGLTQWAELSTSGTQA